MNRPLGRLIAVIVPLVLALAASTATVLAHAYPKTDDPQANARLDAPPAHVGITYDSPITPSGSPIVLLDATGSVVSTTPDAADGNTRASVSPTAELAPGPYTVAWTSLSADDGHTAQGFYTFVVNGGAVGIVNGSAQSHAAAAELTATLTVTSAADGGSLLRVDLSNTTGVERVRIRLSRPDLGEDLARICWIRARAAMAAGSWMATRSRCPGTGARWSSRVGRTSSTMRPARLASRSIQPPGHRLSRRLRAARPTDAGPGLFVSGWWSGSRLVRADEET
jgi:copper resistance protein C